MVAETPTATYTVRCDEHHHAPPPYKEWKLYREGFRGAVGTCWDEQDTRLWAAAPVLLVTAREALIATVAGHSECQYCSAPMPRPQPWDAAMGEGHEQWCWVPAVFAAVQQAEGRQEYKRATDWASEGHRDRTGYLAFEQEAGL